MHHDQAINGWQMRWFATIAIGLTLFLSSYQSVDHLGERYIDESFKRALIGFAVARGLNGVISVAQGTEFSLTPAGMGVNFAPGEILDPVNDLVERFSWIMLLSSSALGVQKVLLSMSGWKGLSLVFMVVGFSLIFLHWVRQQGIQWLRIQLTRVFVLLLILRFMMPMIALCNEWVYQTFLQKQYQSASENLELARIRIGDINEEALPEQPTESPGLIDRAKEVYRSALRQIDFDKRLVEYKAAAETISENTIQLIVVFIMQTVVFPLLFLWIVFTLLKRIVRYGPMSS